jgi:hypothetical protein
MANAGGGSQYEDATAVAAGQKGNIMMGTDGSNLQFVKVDSNGQIYMANAAGGTQYDEDTQHSSGDTGTGALVVRKDTAASLCGADGDYTLLITDANGRLHTLDANSATIASDTTSIDGKITACNTGAVTISAALPAGTNAIGKLSANSGVDIGDVTINNTTVDVTTKTEGKTLIKKTVDATASQTAQDIWTPAGGNKFVITSYVITCTTAGIITLFDETDDTTNRIAKHDMSANSSGNVVFPLPVPSSTADNDLKYTTGTFVGSITVFGYEI